MHTQNDGLEKVTPFKHGNFGASMLDFWGVHLQLVVFPLSLVSFQGWLLLTLP